MSVTRSQRVDRAVAGTADVEAVEVDADSLETTAPEYLRDLKAELAAEGYQPATVTAAARFTEDCSLATQDEANRLRDVVRAASFLGAGTVTLTVEEVCDSSKVRPALEALGERAEREGVNLSVRGHDLSA